MRILSSGEFISEKYVKLLGDKNIFEDYIYDMLTYVTGLHFVKKDYPITVATGGSDKSRGRFDPMEEYGVKAGVVTSDKGSKCVVKFDPSHSIQIYPVVPDNSNDETHTLPYGATVDIYAVAGGKASRIASGLDADLLIDPNRRTYWGRKDRYDTRRAANTAVRDAIRSWGLDSRFVQITNGIKREAAKYKADKEAAEKAENERYARNTERMEKQPVLEFAKDGAPFEPGCGYVFRKWNTMDDGDGWMHMSLPCIVMMTLKEYCRKELSDSLAADVTPDPSGIDDFIAKYKKYMYTPRALPEDNYKNVTCFRNMKRDIPCQHCGKKDIVNVMVIEAPDKKRYLVGSDCVFHLVKLPEDEFEEKWNKPFTTALNIKEMENTDRRREWHRGWYVQKNEYGDDVFMYIGTKTRILDNPWFSDDTIARGNGYKAPRFESHTRLMSEGFMKRMLPEDYLKAVYTDVDMKYVLRCLYPDRQMIKDGYEVFEFGGFKYDFSGTPLYRSIPLDFGSKTIGEFTVSVEDDDGLPGITVKFRNYAVHIYYE